MDPRNRLVAEQLERRWNDKLRELEASRACVAELDKQQQPLSTDERQLLTSFGERFTDVWHDPACPGALKKQIIRTVIEEIVVDDKPAGTLSFIIHWKGGCHTSLQMEFPTTSDSSYIDG